MSIKYQNVYAFKEEMIHLCRSILETRQISHLHDSAPFTIALHLFYRYYFGRCSSELAQLVPLSYSLGKSNYYSDRLHDFSVTISKCYKDVYVKSFFPPTVRLWNSLPIECFPLNYDLSGFKSRINRFPLCFNLFVILFFLIHAL